MVSLPLRAQRDGDNRLGTLSRGGTNFELAAQPQDHVARQEQPQPDAAARLLDHYSLDERAAGNLLQYIDEQVEATGAVPDDRTIVVERFPDEIGDWRVCLLSPFGSRVHAPWALAIEERLARAVSSTELAVLVLELP